MATTLEQTKTRWNQLTSRNWSGDGYFNQNVAMDRYYITVQGDEGFDSVWGGGWKGKGTSFTASGNTRYGYTSNGDITGIADRNKTVTLTSTPWSHTVVYDPQGGSPKPDDFTKTYGQQAYLDGTPH